ncbi:MAG TPA: polyphosphate kinase 1 [Phycisphaerae bacterium]|nr:polyphosphate kinase 1 [Phycisphaerae bacterium]HRY70337.1 polyphosphate kinase 1 [Phycisphaerae bacterium]HSA28054.1 polyphosphate kinase 1 [Phycisphaerae bacterium]
MKPRNYINRELSWLEFNERVLDEARDRAIPLLERIKFLAITASNLDEFFMVRVGGLQQLVRQGSRKMDPAGMSPEEQLEAVSRRTRRMVEGQYSCYLDDIEPALAQGGVMRRRPGELSDRQMKAVEQVFESEVFSVLTPMAVGGDREFPLLTDRMLTLCVRLDPGVGEGDARYAVIPFGRALQRHVTLPAVGRYEYILLEDVCTLFIQRFFPGEHVLEVVPFRINRNADLSVREDLAFDLLEEMEEILDQRKQSPCVRLEISQQASLGVLEFLQRSLDVSSRDVYAVAGPPDLAAYMRLTELQGFEELKYEPWPAHPSPDVDLKFSLFDILSRRDILLYHPFDSFDPVVRLVEESADDPDVLAIKQILYRTSRRSPIVAALARAAERGKHVTALVELKARFDEARNIEWARELEQAGVQVIYGVKGLKTHAKVCIVIRREPHGVQRYVHFGTGNYNEITARQYTDASFMTTHEELVSDATSFFNTITGYSQPQKFRKIEMAPLGLRERLIELIEVETERKRQGRRARIMAKMNSLVDPALIEALYAASSAGVKIRLNVRGICCLRPGVPGLSENISVVSIVDRYLEHSRLFYFYNGGDELVFISSADWMPRNLDRRVELLVPIEDPACKARLVDIMETCFKDTVKGRHLMSDGSYQLPRHKGGRAVRCQESLFRKVRKIARQAEQHRQTTFEPYRPGGEGI